MTTAEFGGVEVDSSLATKKFYGFRQTPDGNLNIEVIGDGDGVVTLPSNQVIDPLDYKQWVWSKATLDFRFSASGHLEMVIL